MRVRLSMLAFLVVVSACSKTESVPLAPTWSVGDAKTIVFTVDRQSKMTINDAPNFSTASNLEIWMDYNVTAVDANNTATLAITYQRAELSETVNLGGNTIVPFAGDDGISPLQKMYSALRGQTFSANIDAAGRVTSLDGVESIVDKLKEVAPATRGMTPMVELTQDQLDELTDTFANVFDDSTTTGFMETVFHLYPGGPVTVGDSWNTQSTGAYGGSTEIVDTTWTLDRAENGLYSLSFAVTFNEAAGKYGETNSGSGTGTATVDASTGMLTGLQATIKNAMNNEADGVTVRDDATQTLTVEIF